MVCFYDTPRGMICYFRTPATYFPNYEIVVRKKQRGQLFATSFNHLTFAHKTFIKFHVNKAIKLSNGRI